MEVWEQHDGEPDEAYVRFLYYRNLGPTRSLDAAYLVYVESGEIESKEKGVIVAPKRAKPLRASGQWKEDSSNYQWEFRSNRWDIHMLKIAGKSVISDFYKLLAVMTSQTLDAVRGGQLVPKTYSQALEGLQTLGNFISPEAAADWVLDGDNGTEKIQEQPANVSSIESKRKAV
jgi:hypothetical protein